MKKKIIIPAVSLAAIVAAGSLFYFAHVAPLEEPKARPAPPPPVRVVAATVTQHDVPVYLVGVGTVIAYNTDVVRAKLKGEIVSVNFTVGHKVHAGYLLAQINPRPYQALVDQYTGQLQRDQSQLANAMTNQK